MLFSGDLCCCIPLISANILFFLLMLLSQLSMCVRVRMVQLTAASKYTYVGISVSLAKQDACMECQLFYSTYHEI